MTATTTDFKNYLRRNSACEGARLWAGGRTAQEAWDECPRADWLMWWLGKAGTDRKTLVRLACRCARTALKFVTEGELRPLKAIETTEAWCDGDASIEEVKSAANAAAYAAYAADAAAYAYDAADAADAAAYAYDAAAADAAAYAAAYAAYAADAAAYAAYAADAAAYAAAAAAYAAYAADAAAYAADAAAAAAAYAAYAADAAAYAADAAARKTAHAETCAIIRATVAMPEVK